MLLETRLKRLIVIGRLTLILPSGRLVEFGDSAPADHLDIVVRLYGAATAFQLGLDPERYLADAYATGRLCLERGSLSDLLELLFVNLARHPRANGWFEHLRYFFVARFEEAKTPGADRGAAIIRHFNKERLYDAFLGGGDPQFSAGFFDHPYTTVDRAQTAARRHLAAKLRLTPNLQVLDTGCGWGGLAIWLAQTFDVTVTGLTLSHQQLLHAREQVRRNALADRVTIEYGDYRSVRARFDRVVTMGSFEHVGAPQYGDYFRAVSSCLNPAGLALIHSTGRLGPPRALNPWVRRRLFPGSHIPSLSEVSKACQASELRAIDVEIYRLHGAETLRLWRQALSDKAWTGVDDDGAQQRTWEFFLTASEMAFRYGDLVTFEALLTPAANAPPGTGDRFAKTEVRSMAGEQQAQDAEERPMIERRSRHANETPTKAA
jgi:cyclopropane-fatty-acyl-phospholipid synthase